jgi:DNA-binding GntR family transcriptional regulator
MGQRGLKEHAYAEIRRRILEGEILPSSPLSEHQLATTLHLSRTPVREAIKRLEREGLVRSIPNRGTFIAELSAQDIREIYQVRERLEGLATRIAAEQMSAEAMQTLEHEVALTAAFAAEGRIGEIFQSDIRFHKLIIATTHNWRLSTILGTLDDQMYRVRAIFPRSADWLEATLRDHTAIVEGIKARDGKRAEQAMEQHLQSACERAMRLVMPLRLG